VREALQQSLNIPAVAVLEQVGPARVAARLREVGLPLHWSAAHPQPGLPLVLGGVGMTLEELVALYAGFANGGRVAPPRFGPADPDGPDQGLLTETACWYLTDILRTAPTPQNVLTAASVAKPRAIAHKTGTSYGFRDAWALGFDADHTVGVWVADRTGRPVPAITGATPPRRCCSGRSTCCRNRRPGRRAGRPPGCCRSAATSCPRRLRYFRARPALETAGVPPLGITFPVAGSTVELPDATGCWPTCRSRPRAASSRCAGW